MVVNCTTHMQLQTGHIHLFDIYKFVAGNPKLVSGKNGDMSGYTKLVNNIVSSIPNDKPGWYLWGKFNNVGWWETVYLGKAGNKKTSSLRARIKEELLDERCSFWATLFGIESISKQFKKIFKDKYGDNNRQYRKMGTHFIIWASAEPISEEEILQEEKTLITLYRPAVNIQRVSYPPHTQNTEHVLRAIDFEIQKILK